MKTVSLMVAVVSIVIVSLVLVACVPMQVSHLEADRGAFTRLIDEPSARGQLTRISPEQHNIMLRFALSPDETEIVYSGMQYKGGDRLFHLWKIPSNGSGSPVKITSGGSAHYLYPSFTSDGNFIVYQSQGQIWRVRSDGAGGKMRIPGLGNGTDTAPHISTKNKVVFNTVQSSPRPGGVDHNYLIWTSNLDGGELTQIREGANPRWSPDGDRIVFEYDDDIWMINADGTSLMQLTNTTNVSERLPSFSSDGKRIVFTSNEGADGKRSPSWNVWSINVEGSEKTQITQLEAWDSWPVWGESGIYFLSSRAQNRYNEFIQRIWRLRIS